MIRKIFFLATLLFLASFQQGHAQCSTSTCISGAMIDLAETRNITWDRVESHFDLLDPAADCSVGMIQSGVVTYKWFSAQRLGEWVNGPDHFCIVQGCSLLSDVDAPNIENHRCE